MALLAQVFTPPQYVVTNLLATGRKRPSILAGKPHCGKSTLAWQLAVSVCKGESILGRNTQRGSVLYASTEESPADIQAKLRQLGYSPDTDAPLYILTGEARLESVRDELERHPDILLVVLETLPAFLHVPDLNSNSDVLRGFANFEKVLGDFTSKTAFLGLCHLRKRYASQIGDTVMGASAIRGCTDATIFIQRREDGRRMISAETRVGEGIAPHFLDFDTAAGRSTLGLPVSEERRLGVENTRERIKNQIIEFFALHPDTTFRSDCLPTLTGNRDTARHVFAEMIRSGLIVKSGAGTKGSPELFRLRDAIKPERAA